MSDDFHTVLVKGRWARVLGPQSFLKMRPLEEDGWRVIWDSARSDWDGYRHAAAFEKCVPQDWEDSFGGTPIERPVRLFRSVSPRELVDIAQRGLITGRGNTFNEFDPRRFVFFGDAISPGLINQGEELERQAIAYFSGDVPFLEFEALRKAQADVSARFVLRCREVQGAHDRVSDRAYLDRCLDAAGRGNPSAAFQAITALRSNDASLAVMLDEMRGHATAITRCRESFSKLSQDWIREEEDAREEYPFTSCILETVPLAHGFSYSERNGTSGMGDEDEYGFFSGSVMVEDFVSLHLVKGGAVVDTVPAGDLERLADDMSNAISRYRLGVGLAA